MSFFSIKLSSFWRDVAWLASGTALANLIGLASWPIFSRMYAPTDFAALNLFTICVGFASIVITWRYENLIQLPKRLADSWRLVQVVVLLGGAAVLVLTPLAWWLGPKFAMWLGHPLLAPWLVLVPLASLIFSLSTALAAWHQKRRQFRSSGQSQAVGQLANAVLGVGGRLLLTGPGGLILAFFGTYGGKIIWLIKNRREIYPIGSLVKIKAMAQRYGHLSRGLIFSQTCLIITTAIPSLYIVRAHGAEELGQFTLAWQVIVQPAAIFGNAIGSTYYQRAAAMWAQGSGLKDLWLSTARKLFWLGLPVYGAAFCFSPWLFPLIYGPSWTAAGHYTVLLSVSAFFLMLTDPLERTCLVVEAVWYLPLWQAARMLSTALTAGVAWLYSWPMGGFLLAFTAQQTLLFSIDYFLLRRLAGRRPRQTLKSVIQASPVVEG